MTPYQRFFGGALIGWAVSLLLLWMAFRLEPLIPLQPIHNDPVLGQWVLLVSGIFSGTLAMWTHFSLPPLSRGKRLVTTGAFKYLRHPIYASFLILFLGFAFWMDHWLFMVWAVAQIPAWHLTVLGEERLMRQDFPEYEEYCRRTCRFIPGIW